MNQPFRLLRGGPPRRAAAWATAAAFFLTLAPAAGQAPGGAGAPAAAVPANALAFATLDLRPDTPGMKVWLDLMKPQDRAIGEASLLLLGQLGLAYLGEGLDMEKDVLPWLGRRVHVLELPGAAQDKPPRVVALLEVKEEAAAAKAVEAILARAAETTRGKVERATAAGIPVHRLTLPNQQQLEATVRGGLLAVGLAAGALEAWMQAPPAAPGAQPSWARALASVPPGMVTMAFSPSVLGKQGGTAAALGIAGVALSSGAGPEGGRMVAAADMSAAPKDSIGERLAVGLAQVKLTGEALAAVPANALAAATLAPPADILKALGVEPLFYMALGQMMGPQGQALSGRLRPALQQLLAGEVTVALLDMAPQPQAAALFTTPDPAAAAGVLSTLRQTLAAVPGVRLGAPQAGAEGFTLTLPGKNPLTLQVGAAGRWVVAGTDPAALRAVTAAAGGADGGTGLLGHPAYQRVHQQLGEGALLEIYMDTRALGRAATVYGMQMALREALTRRPETATPEANGQAGGQEQPNKPGAGKAEDELAVMLRRVPPAYFTRLADAFLLPYEGGGAGLAMRDRVAYLTLYQHVDWSSVSASASAAPMAAGVAAAVALPALARSREQGKAALCQANQKQLVAALHRYAEEHDGRLPPAENWREALVPYVENEEVFRCPAGPAQRASGYAFNVRLSGRKAMDILDHEKVVAFFDSDSEAGSPADVGGSLPDPPRHRGGNHFAFLDGHVEALAEVPAGAWVPEMRPAPPAPRTAAPAPKKPAARKPAPKPAPRRPAPARPSRR